MDQHGTTQLILSFFATVEVSLFTNLLVFVLFLLRRAFIYLQLLLFGDFKI